MAFYENMSNARKRVVLTTSKDSLESEMLQTVIRLGLDPDTFDEKTYVADDSGPFVSDSQRLKTICDSYVSVIEKLNNLGD